MWDDPQTGLTYVDVAGLLDTAGDMVQLVNSFVIKEIFRRAKTVRFLIPVTKSQISESRGAAVREQL